MLIFKQLIKIPKTKFPKFSIPNPKFSFNLSSNPSSSSMAVVQEEGLATKFWIKFNKESVFAKYTPFIVCLGSGKLQMEAFRGYIGQDRLFLKSFADAYELTEECADDDDAKVAICELKSGVVEELKLHDSFVNDWGFDPAKDSVVNPATVKYTDFLLATASGKVEGGKGLIKISTPFEKTKIAAYTLGAMTPCMRLYAYIGKELQALMDPDDTSHPYKKWIDSYSSDNYEGWALKTEDLLDKLSISLTGEELEVIEKLYHQAMELEIDFFCAQPIVQRTIVPLLGVQNSEHQFIIFSDFDLTCTVVDSSAILAEIAIVTAPKADLSEPENALSRKSSADLRNTWDDLSSQYTEEYEQCIESVLPTEKAVEFDYGGLCQALERMSDFEKRANSRVINSGVLKGINLEDVKRAGERLMLQDGCARFFQKIEKIEPLVDVHLISYCWCSDLIRSAFSSGGLNVTNIHANEFLYEESIATGEIVKNVESPKDKVQVFKETLKSKNDESQHLSIYIGDSMGDLLCLLEADIGIVIGSSSSLRRVGSEFGVSFVPLFSGLVKKQKQLAESERVKWNRLSGTLYTVSSWDEIHSFILGTDSTQR